MEKSYYHIGAQIIAQVLAPDGRNLPGATEELFYYVHDRLGSVRAVIDTDMLTVNSYTYDPFGKLYQEESYEAVDSQTGQLIAENPFKYAGQYYDAEIGQYYVRARMYDPTMRRFTGRDPVRGKYEESLSLHKYLYCWNNSINRTDLNGRIPSIAYGVVAGYAVYGMALSVATEGAARGDDRLFDVGLNMMNLIGPAIAFGTSVGPLTRLGPTAMEAGAAAWNGLTAGMSAIAGTANVSLQAANQAAFWVLTNPTRAYIGANIADIIGVYCESPDAPATPGGLLASLYRYFDENDD